jgi:hypothetical protein
MDYRGKNDIRTGRQQMSGYLNKILASSDRMTMNKHRHRQG